MVTKRAHNSDRSDTKPNGTGRAAGDKFSVIVSHPARQAIVYYRPMGAERMGIDVKLLTGVYYKPNQFPYNLARWAPARKRKAILELLELRRVEGLSPENVITILGPLLEGLYRAGILSLHRWWEIWDHLAARWIRSRRIPSPEDQPTLIHCFIECGMRTLRSARRKQMTCLLEVTLPPLLADEAQMQKWGVTKADFPTDIERLKKELAEADFVLVQSDFGVRTIRALGFPASRILCLHLGLDTDKFRPREGPREPGPLRVIFVGQINRRKGIHHLVQAWQELGLENAELVLAGNTESAQPELLSAIRETPRCRMAGHLRGDDLLSLYQQADMLVHPSLAEGGCAAIYEGLGCGVPCIVSDHSTSAVRTEVEGIVVPVGDVEALKAAILRLAGDAALRERMSAAARRRAVDSLSMAAFSREIAAIYRGVASMSQRGGRDREFEGDLVTAF